MASVTFAIVSEASERAFALPSSRMSTTRFGSASSRARRSRIG